LGVSAISTRREVQAMTTCLLTVTAAIAEEAKARKVDIHAA
jgi:hypothetical protein